MFEKGSDVKQSNVTERKYGPQCALLGVLGMGYIILLWHSLSLPYNYFSNKNHIQMAREFHDLNMDFVV